MRSTIKRLSIENQRLKVNYHLEARDIKESQSHQEQLDEANSQLTALAQENVSLKRKVQTLQELKPNGLDKSQFAHILSSLAESS